MYACMELCDPTEHCPWTLSHFLQFLSLPPAIEVAERQCFLRCLSVHRRGVSLRGGGFPWSTSYVKRGCHEGTPLLINKRVVLILLEWFLVLFSLCCTAVSLCLWLSNLSGNLSVGMCFVFVAFSISLITLITHSHRAKERKIKEQDQIKTTNIKENFRFNFRRMWIVLKIIFFSILVSS